MYIFEFIYVVTAWVLANGYLELLCVLVIGLSEEVCVCW